MALLNSDLFRVKNIDQLLSDADQPERRLKKTLGWISLTALGVGAIIGTGIFILTGTAAAGEVVEYPSILKAPVLQVVIGLAIYFAYSRKRGTLSAEQRQAART